MGGSSRVSIFMQYGFRGAKGSPTIWLYREGGVPVMEYSFSPAWASWGRDDSSAQV